MKKHILLAVKILVLVIVLYFMYANLPLSVDDIGAYLLHAHTLFYLAIGVFTVFLSMQASVWVLILNATEKQISLFRGLVIYTTSQCARYIPGGVWNIVGRIYFTSKYGVQMNKQILTLFYEHAMLVITSVTFGLFLLYQHHVISWPILLVLVAVVPASYYFYQPLTHFIQRHAHRFPARIQGSFTGFIPRERVYALLTFSYLSHLLQGVSFWLLLKTFDIASIDVLTAASIFVVSWLIGLLSPLPGGLGLREGALVYLLSFYMPLTIATQVSIIARIWTLMGELMLFSLITGIDFILKRMTKKYGEA